MLARFPSRFRLFHASLFAALLCTFELMQGSDSYCVACIFLFILVGTDAFNRTGGLQYPSGSYIFFFAVLVLLAGATWKALLWEPLDRNLKAPQLTLTVYLGAISAMWIAATLNARFRRKDPLLKAKIPVQQELRAAMGCLLAGISLNLLSPFLVMIGIASVLHQISFFYPLAVMLAVYSRVRQTNGEKSFSGVAFAAWSVSFFIGILSFSKQGLFTPFVAWIFGALAAGYKTSWKQIAIISAVAVSAVMVLVPYSQYGRDHRDELADPFQVMVMMVTDPMVFAEKAQTTSEGRVYVYRFYDEPQGLMERLTMITLDDPLILRSSMGHYEGWSVLRAYLVNTLPRVVLPNKPTLKYGNVYAHEIGILAPADVTTGVSFSPAAEAFHVAGWAGIFLILPTVLFCTFVISDSLVGSLRQGPWALFFILTFSHAAPETGFGGPIYQSVYGVAAVVFSVFMATKVAPLAGAMFMGPGKAPVQTGFRSKM